MASRLYDPFSDFAFGDRVCFLTGKALDAGDGQLPVFPGWMIREFDLEDKPFRMLDENTVSYGSLQLPCSAGAARVIGAVEAHVERAMLAGFEAVADLDQLDLFHCTAKILYGVVFNEIRAGMRQVLLSGETMNFSQALAHKFRNLHRMLQSLIVPMEFERCLPFSVLVLPVDSPPGTFSYRDEINTLVLSLRMRDFAIIATLQDNGTNAVYHEDVLQKISGKPLTPMQFEEICARYFYSAYLFNRLPEYTYMETPDKVYVEPMPLNDWTQKPLFDPWQAKTYAQVLENFWKPWGITQFEILKKQEKRMSFL